MKKNLIIPALAVMAAVSFSCSKENIEGGGSASAADGSFAPKSVIKASLSDTRTTLSDHSILWKEGDMISLFADDGTPVEYVLSAGAGTASAEFTANETPETEMSAYAIYPATGASMVGDIAYINVNEQQNYVEDGFATYYPMAAITADGESYTFENLATVLSLPLTGDAAVKSITLETVGGEGLAGAASVDFSGAVPVLKASAEGASGSVTLTCAEPVQLSADNETVFNFVLIPGEYEGLKITVATEKGTEIEKTTSALTLKAGSFKYFDSPIGITDWQIVGTFTNNWNTPILMEISNGVYCAKNVNIPAGGAFKLRYGNDWNDKNFGLGYNNNPTTIATESGVEIYSGQANLVIEKEGVYDIYFFYQGTSDADDDNYIFVMTAGTVPQIAVTGTLTTANAWSDIPMVIENGMFVAKDVVFEDTDDDPMRFKIRTPETWSGQYNLGFPNKPGNIAFNTALNVVNNGNDMYVTEVGTYDIWFDLCNMQVWVMNNGQKPF